MERARPDTYSTRNVRVMLVANPTLTDDYFQRLAAAADKTHQVTTLNIQRTRARMLRARGHEHEAWLPWGTYLKRHSETTP